MATKRGVKDESRGCGGGVGGRRRRRYVPNIEPSAEPLSTPTSGRGQATLRRVDWQAVGFKLVGDQFQGKHRIYMQCIGNEVTRSIDYLRRCDPESSSDSLRTLPLHHYHGPERFPRYYALHVTGLIIAGLHQSPKGA